MKTLILLCLAFTATAIQAQTSPPWDSVFIGTQGNNNRGNDTVNMGSGNVSNGAVNNSTNTNNSGAMNNNSGSNHTHNGTDGKMNHGANSGGMKVTTSNGNGSKMKNSDKTTADNTGMHNSSKDMHSDASHPKNYYVVKNGTVMHMNAGTSTKVSKEVTLSNGSVIALNGKVKTKDGKIIKLSEGERVDMDGNILPSKNKYSPATK